MKVSEAVENLKEHQRQLDMDGCFVGVSRQALEMVLNSHEALRLAAGALLTCPDRLEALAKNDLSRAHHEASQ